MSTVKNAKVNLETARQELKDYKEKAGRILQVIKSFSSILHSGFHWLPFRLVSRERPVRLFNRPRTKWYRRCEEAAAARSCWAWRARSTRRRAGSGTCCETSSTSCGTARSSSRQTSRWSATQPPSGRFRKHNATPSLSSISAALSVRPLFLPEGAQAHFPESAAGNRAYGKSQRDVSRYDKLAYQLSVGEGNRRREGDNSWRFER